MRRGEPECAVRRMPEMILRSSTALLLAFLLLATAPGSASSQDGGDDGPSKAASEGTLGEGSRPVGDGASVYDSSERGMLSGPVGQGSGPVGARRGMLSPSIGEVSVGSARSGRAVYSGGTVNVESGAVVNPPQPYHYDRPVNDDELRQLQEQLRAIEPLPE